MLSSLHFGQGETAQDIKMTADYLGVEVVLGQIACIGFLLFFTIGVLIFFLLRGENHLRELYALREQNQSLLIEDRISKERSRFDFELRYLMHDLKSPLTSLQLLVSAFKMTCSFSEDDERWDQLENMEMAIHRMNRMVSEMQDSSSRFLIKTEELCATIMSETSITEYQNCIICENHIPNEYIDINQSLFCRAIINLFENAYSARRGDADFCILFTVRKEITNGEEKVCFCIKDNGLGVSKENLPKLKEIGYTTNGSSGLGLPFVYKVVKQMDGDIFLESTEGVGTKISIFLPKGDQYE